MDGRGNAVHSTPPTPPSRGRDTRRWSDSLSTRRQSLSRGSPGALRSREIGKPGQRDMFADQQFGELGRAEQFEFARPQVSQRVVPPIAPGGRVGVALATRMNA